MSNKELFATLQTINGICKASLEKKKCFTCERALDVSDFYRKGKNRPDYFAECKECLAARRKRKIKG